VSWKIAFEELAIRAGLSASKEVKKTQEEVVPNYKTFLEVKIDDDPCKDNASCDSDYAD
jgi:hypothetical protein